MWVRIPLWSEIFSLSPCRSISFLGLRLFRRYYSIGIHCNCTDSTSAYHIYKCKPLIMMVYFSWFTCTLFFTDQGVHVCHKLFTKVYKSCLRSCQYSKCLCKQTFLFFIFAKHFHYLLKIAFCFFCLHQQYYQILKVSFG